MSAEWHAAMAGWLDSESQYRLRIEQAKEAAEGAKFAEEQYEKYRQAQKSAKENYETGLAKHDKERDELDGERKLIKMIMASFEKSVIENIDLSNTLFLRCNVRFSKSCKSDTCCVF